MKASLAALLTVLLAAPPASAAPCAEAGAADAALPSPPPDPPPTQIVYLNFDGAAGRWAIKYGANDTHARTDGSVSGVTEFPPYSAKDGATRAANVNRMYALVTGYFYDMNVAFTMTRPTGGRYTEVIVTSGESARLMPSKGAVSGAAPIDPGNANMSNIAFVFANGDGPDWLARAIAHELGHSFGLYHTTGDVAAVPPADMMCESSACTGAGRWDFKYKDSALEVPGWVYKTQNSYKYLMETLGARRAP
jgi:hypothetical protein